MILISDAELEAMRDEYLDPDVIKWYMLCVRPFMDYDTGISGGPKRRISYQQFRETLTRPARRGSNKPGYIPTLERLRWIVKEAARVGLVAKPQQPQRNSPLVFKCPLAVVGQLRPHEAPHKHPIEAHQPEPHQNFTENPTAAWVSYTNNGREHHEARHTQTAEAPHTSDISDKYKIKTTAPADANIPDPEYCQDFFVANFGHGFQHQAADPAAAPEPIPAADCLLYTSPSPRDS